jgi:hypothetical protein
MEPDRAGAEPEAGHFLDHRCLDKATNWNDAFAVSRITQNDQIGLLEPG